MRLYIQTLADKVTLSKLQCPCLKKMETTISRNILWAEWDTACEHTVHIVGEKQMVTMTKWLCPRMIQSQFWQEFQSGVIATHTIQQLQNQTWPEGDIPIAFVLKALISFPSPVGIQFPNQWLNLCPLQQKPQSHNHWTTREVWKSLYFDTHYIRMQMIKA